MTKRIDFGKLQINITEVKNEAIYSFYGDVDEGFRHKDVPLLKDKTISFDLQNIQNFNSCGIREWVYMMKAFEPFGTIRFLNCSVSMVDQLNMVPESLGNGKVESFYAPYYCRCGGECNKLIQTEKSYQDLLNKKAPDFKCEKCGKPLEFDALEESYFLFAEGGFQQAS